MLQPYVDHVFDSFGPDRVMYSGNWPVLLLSATYQIWVDTIDALTSALSAQDRQKFFYQNANVFYRLEQF